MKQISLTRGKFALVDDEDYETLSQWKWYASYCSHVNGFYAKRSLPRTEQSRNLKMHRFIMNLTVNESAIVDHINGNTLDNRRSNLRIVTPSQNCCNRKVRRDNRSGMKGVSFRRNRWMARIQFEGKRLILGYFADPESARSAYREAAARLHGEYAKL